MNSITKMRRINYSAKRNQIKVYKGKFGKFNLENNVIHDDHNVICDSNSAILALELFQLKIVKLREFFP